MNLLGTKGNTLMTIYYLLMTNYRLNVNTVTKLQRSTFNTKVGYIVLYLEKYLLDSYKRALIFSP